MKKRSNISNNLVLQESNIHSRITMLVDNELPIEEQEKLLIELKQNPEWQLIYEQELKFKAFIRKNTSLRKAPPSLIDNIKLSIKIPADS